MPRPWRQCLQNLKAVACAKIRCKLPVCGRVVIPEILFATNYQGYDIFGPKMASETIFEPVVVNNFLGGAYPQTPLRAACLCMCPMQHHLCYGPTD